MEIISSEQHERDVAALRTVTVLGLNGTNVEKRLIEEAAADMTNAYVGLIASAFAAVPNISYETSDDKPAERVSHVPRHQVTQHPDCMFRKAAGAEGDLSL